MHHFFEAITNTRGDSLVGFYARVIDPTTLAVVPIYADNAATPIDTVSGIANMGKTDADGNLSFYVAYGTYHLDLYSTDSSTFVKRVRDVAMEGMGQPDIDALNRVDADLQLGPDDSFIYRAPQAAIDAVTAASLAVPAAAAAAADAAQAAIDRAYADNAANTALAALSAYGNNVLVFGSYANAAAAIGTTLSNGMYAEIMSDENDLFERTRRPVSGGALGAVSAELPKLVNGSDPTFMATTHTRFVELLDPADGTLKQHIYPHIYLDEVNGLDTNDGSCGVDRGGGKGPIKTVAHMRTLPAFQDGVTIGLKDNVVWSNLELDFAESNTGNGSTQRNRMSVVPYGQGRRLMRNKGTDPVPAASWSASISNPGAYEINWTHAMYQSATAAIMCVQKQSNTVIPWEPLVAKQNKNQVTGPGMYWYDNTLSDAGTEAMCVWPWGSLNLTTSPDGTIELTKRRYAMSGRSGCFFSGFLCFAHGCNNGSVFTYDTPVVQRMAMVLGGKHNAVLGGGYGTDLGLYNCQPSTSYWPQSTGILLTCFEGDLSLRSPVFTRCHMWCDDTLNTHADSGKLYAQSFYSHAAGGGLGVSLTLKDCSEGNCVAGAAHTIYNSVTLDGHYAAGFNGNNAGFGMGTGAYLTVRASLFVARGAGSGNRTFTLPAACTVDFQGSMIIGNPSAGFFSCAGSIALTIKNSVFMSEPAASQYMVSAGTGLAASRIDIQNNIFSYAFYGVLDFGTNATDTPLSITIDNNYYDMYPDIGGSADPIVARYKNHLYYALPHSGSTDKDFTTDWQGVLGFDVHSVQGNYSSGPDPNSDSVGWAGNSPNSANPQLAVLGGGSPMAGKISILPTATITAMLARPSTVAAFVAYAESTACPTYFPVYEG